MSGEDSKGRNGWGKCECRYPFQPKILISNIRHCWSDILKMTILAVIREKEHLQPPCMHVCNHKWDLPRKQSSKIGSSSLYLASCVHLKCQMCQNISSMATWLLPALSLGTKISFVKNTSVHQSESFRCMT